MHQASPGKRFAILGNSGSGKSTLASALASYHAVRALDLDTIAWVPGTVGVARDPDDAAQDVRNFCTGNDAFVIEGCYERLIAESLSFRPLLIFLDVDVQVCGR